MSQQYRTCQTCGATLTAGQTYCPRCGAPYIEPIVQQPGEFEPFPPEQPAPASPVEPYVAQQPIVPPSPQPQSPYPPQGQGYAPPPQPSQYSQASYGQQAPVTPGPGQVDSSTQPPTSQNEQGLRINMIIGGVVVGLLLLVGVGSLFYYLGHQSVSTPGTTPTPGVTPTPTPTPTPGVTPTPTATPATTPTAASFRTPATVTSVIPLYTVYSRGGLAPPWPLAPRLLV